MDARRLRARGSLRVFAPGPLSRGVRESGNDLLGLLSRRPPPPRRPDASARDRHLRELPAPDPPRLRACGVAATPPARRPRLRRRGDVHLLEECRFAAWGSRSSPSTGSGSARGRAPSPRRPEARQRAAGSFSRMGKRWSSSRISGSRRSGSICPRSRFSPSPRRGAATGGDAGSAPKRSPPSTRIARWMPVRSPRCCGSCPTGTASGGFT